MLEKILTTQVLSQLLSVASFIVIPSYIGVEGYGSLNAILAYLSFSQIMTLPFLERELLLKFNSLTSLSRNNLFSTKMYLSFLSTIIFFLILKINYSEIIGSNIYLLAFMPISASLITLHKNAVFSLKKGDFLAKFLFIFQTSNTILILLSAIIFNSFVVLLIVKIIHEFFFSAYINFYIHSFSFSKKITFKENLQLFKKYMPFYAGNFLNYRADLILLDQIASKELLGIYSLCFRIIEKVSGAFNVYYLHLLAKNISPRFNRTRIILINVMAYLGISGMLGMKLIFSSYYEILNLFMIYGLVLILFSWSSEESNFFQRADMFKELGLINIFTGIINLLSSYILFDVFGIYGVAISTVVCLFINIQLLRSKRIEEN